MGSKPEENQKPRRGLGRYIMAAFFINIIAIMTVGGVCIKLVGDMVENIRRLERESNDVARAGGLNNRLYSVIYTVDQALLKKDPYSLIYGLDILEDLETDIRQYITEENGREEVDNDEEVRMAREIAAGLEELGATLAALMDDFDKVGKAFPRERLAILDRQSNRVQELTRRLQEYHFQIIRVLVADSYQHMSMILSLYIASALIGIIASVVGYLILTRNTVHPIKNLAAATRQVADGDLSVRLDSRSTTEIGELYESFNVMTQRLEDHERQMEEFNRALEQKVEERTAELKNAQAELLRMEKIATLGQVASMVNHEIKTPLNALYLNLQLLNRQFSKINWNDDADRRRLESMTAVLDGEIMRISELLEEFVQYARFAPPNFAAVDLDALVNRVAETIRPSAEEAKVRVECETAAAEKVRGDEKKLTQALMNLCVNAIHAMEKDGGVLTLRTRADGNSTVLEVADTGCGIEPADLEKIFEPFFTTREKGTGFGLAIVKRIIEDHNGTISCTSEPGRGAVFTITLENFQEGDEARRPEES